MSEEPFLPYSSIFFGDYTNITAYNQQVRPIWTRAEGSSRSIWTAIIDMTVDVDEPEEISPFSLSQNYPNPFRETTLFSFKLREPTIVTLAVYDIYGRQITTLINRESMSRGKYERAFVAENYALSPGVYWFVLRQGNAVEKRKMLLIE